MKYRRYSTAQLNAISRSYTQRENKDAFNKIKSLLGIDSDSDAERAIKKFKQTYNLRTDSYKVIRNSMIKRQSELSELLKEF